MKRWVLLGSAFGFKQVYVAAVVSEDYERVVVRYPRNPEPVTYSRDEFARKYRRALLTREVGRLPL